MVRHDVFVDDGHLLGHCRNLFLILKLVVAFVAHLRALAVAKLPIPLHLLFHGVLHASLGCTSLGRTCRDLRSCTCCHDPLGNLNSLLLCLLHLYLLLFLPLILHVLVERYRVVLLLIRLRQFLRRAQTWYIRILVRDLWSLSIYQAAIVHELPRLLWLLRRLV